MTKARPFIRWVGGKSQLLEQFENYYPNELRKGIITNYVELLWVSAGRAINCNGEERGKINELIITNYPYEQKRPSSYQTF